MSIGAWEAQWWFRVRRVDGSVAYEGDSRYRASEASRETGCPLERQWHRSEVEWREES